MSEQPSAPGGQPPPAYQPPPPSHPNPLIPQGNQTRKSFLEGVNPRIWVGVVIGIVVIVVLLVIVSLPRGSGDGDPIRVALEQTSTQNAAIFITLTFSAITPTIDPQISALQTQNALLIQGATNQAVPNQPTQMPVIVVPPTQVPPQIITATSQSGGQGSVATVAGQGGTTVCPPATNDNYTTPTTVTVTGRAIVHPWWNNNKPSWRQNQVRILLSPDETVTFVDMMGRVYTYQNTPACDAIMPQEFGNATFPIVTIQDLVSQGLAKTDTCPTSPSEVAGLIGGQARYWDFEPTSQHTGWLYAAASPAVTMIAPNFGHIDYWNGQAGKISNGQQAQNVTQATFWCGG